MKYKEVGPYQLEEDYIQQIGIYPHEDIVTKYITLTTTGLLRILAGYAWDGPSGTIKKFGISIDLTRDDKYSMTPSLVHDALSELMRKGFISKMHFTYINTLFRHMLHDRVNKLNDGIRGIKGVIAKARKIRLRIKFEAWYEFVSALDFYVDPKNIKPVLEVP